ncbi:hypothetical protein MRY16398_46040 [Phytobacter sp. MRY16-398]|nr:hypothetical protein MRY16398_46040 [Phytobacter sp. MRY16-398]
MADDFGVGRCLLQSGEQVLASTHVVTVPFGRLEQTQKEPDSKKVIQFTSEKEMPKVEGG